jgi:hypothetical protein
MCWVGCCGLGWVGVFGSGMPSIPPSRPFYITTRAFTKTNTTAHTHPPGRGPSNNPETPGTSPRPSGRAMGALAAFSQPPPLLLLMLLLPRRPTHVPIGASVWMDQFVNVSSCICMWPHRWMIHTHQTPTHLLHRMPHVKLAKEPRVIALLAPGADPLLLPPLVGTGGGGRRGGVAQAAVEG